jgi:hypothetical protein
VNDHPLPIPVAAFDDRLGFVGLPGSGKTYGAGIGIERILQRHGRVIIIDLLGVWWGLRLDADGKAPSHFDVVIFGGPHGDVALTEHAGGVIGEAVADMSESCIVDLSGIGTKAGERRFLLAFLTALYRRASGEPVHLICDECDAYAPQQIRDRDGEAAKLLGMVETIVRRGRIKGFIPWLITQRPAVINKDVFTMIDGLVVFKLTSSQDRDAIGNWVENQADKAKWRELWSEMPTLDIGQGLVWIPARSIERVHQFPHKQTFDSSRSPKRGEKRALRQLTPLDLTALRARLATVEAESKANDPRELKARIVELERKLLAADNTQGMLIEVEREKAEAEQRGYATGYNYAHAQLIRDAKPYFDNVITCVNVSHQQVEKLWQWLIAPAAAPSQPATPTVEPLPEGMVRKGGRNIGPSQITTRPPPPAPMSSTRPGRRSPRQRLLDSLAWWFAVGQPQPRRAQVALLAGYKPNTGTFNTYMSALNTEDLVNYPGDGRITLTNSGAKQAHTPEGRLDHAALMARLDSVLSGPQMTFMKVLAGRWPQAISRDDLGLATDYRVNTGTFNTYLSSLKTLELIEYPQSGVVKAVDWLFP